MVWKWKRELNWLTNAMVFTVISDIAYNRIFNYNILFNPGFSCLIITFILLTIGTYFGLPISFVSSNFLPLMMASIVFSFTISILLYARSWKLPKEEMAEEANGATWIGYLLIYHKFYAFVSRHFYTRIFSWKRIESKNLWIWLEIFLWVETWSYRLGYFRYMFLVRSSWTWQRKHSFMACGFFSHLLRCWCPLARGELCFIISYTSYLNIHFMIMLIIRKQSSQQWT